MSAALDDLAINGDGQSPNPSGIFDRLGNPDNPAAGVETWTRFLAVQAGGVDGLWASRLSEVGIVVNPATYRLAAATFQGTDSEESAASYLSRMGAGRYAFWTNSRMPAAPAAGAQSGIAQGVLVRRGRPGMRMAVMPMWAGGFEIDDRYSRAAQGERVYTIASLVGDVILTQPDSYEQVAFRVSV